MNRATSRFYSWVVAVVLVVTALTLASVLSYLPQASLAGVILFAAWTLIDWVGWRALRRMRWGEVLVAAGCASGVVILGILPGIAIAVALSITDLLRPAVAAPTTGSLGLCPAWRACTMSTTTPTPRRPSWLVVYRYDSPLFFANADDFERQRHGRRRRPRLPAGSCSTSRPTSRSTSPASMPCSSCPTPWASGASGALARVKNDLMGPMVRYGVIDVIGAENMYATLPTAVAAFREWAEGQPTPGQSTGGGERLKQHRFARSDNPRRPQPKPPV